MQSIHWSMPVMEAPIILSGRSHHQSLAADLTIMPVNQCAWGQRMMLSNGNIVSRSILPSAHLPFTNIHGTFGAGNRMHQYTPDRCTTMRIQRYMRRNHLISPRSHYLHHRIRRGSQCRGSCNSWEVAPRFCRSQRFHRRRSTFVGKIRTAG